jgi:glutathione S-transferase
LVLAHKGLTWEEIPPPGGYGSAAYKEVVPSGNLPALRDGDLLLADSEAFAEYLKDIAPEPPMLPPDLQLQAQARERGRFHDTRLEPALRSLFPHLPPKQAVPAALVAAQRAAISARLAQFADMLEATPDMGIPLTLGDCGFPITFACIDDLTEAIALAVEWPKPVLALS